MTETQEIRAKSAVKDCYQQLYYHPMVDLMIGNKPRRTEPLSGEEQEEKIRDLYQVLSGIFK